MMRLHWATASIVLLAAGAPVASHPAAAAPLTNGAWSIPAGAAGVRIELDGDSDFIQSVTLAPAPSGSGTIRRSISGTADPSAVEGALRQDGDVVVFSARRVRPGARLLVRYDVAVPCCMPVAVNVGYGSLKSSGLANPLALAVESGALQIDGGGTCANRPLSARVTNGSLSARLPPATSVRARVENGPPSTWASGSSIETDLRPADEVRVVKKHGAELTVRGSSAVATLEVGNGLLSIRERESAPCSAP